MTVAELCGVGLEFGVTAALHVARSNASLPDGALMATTAPEPYAELRVGVLALNR